MLIVFNGIIGCLDVRYIRICMQHINNWQNMYAYIYAVQKTTII